jgi:hypothetical protein
MPVFDQGRRRVTITTIRFSESEHNALTALADKAQVSLADACRLGSRLYLEAVTAPKTPRGRPKKEAKKT